MSEGWIKLHRQILDNPITMKDTDHFALWCYLLLRASHKDQDVVFHGKRHQLKAGDIYTGRKRIANDLNVSESKVQRMLKLLESEQQIEQRTDRQNRIITIKKWNEYQVNEQRFEQRVNNDRTTSEHIQEGKNVKNEKNTYVCKPETEALLNTIDELCQKYGVKNNVNKKSLDVLVDRYIGKVRLKVEVQHCISWLIEKNLKTVSAQRIGNWFKTAQKIQKREELRLLDSNKTKDIVESLDHFTEANG